MTTTLLSGRPAVSTGRLVRARLRSGKGLAALIAAAIAVAVGLLGALPATATTASAAAISAAIPDPATPDGWLQVHTRIAADEEVQDDEARAVISGLLGADVAVETVRLGEPGSDSERTAWRLTPAPAALNAAGVERLAYGLARVPDAIRGSDAAEGGIVVTGGLAEAAAGVAESAAAAAAIIPVPVVILAVLAWFAVLQLARLLGASRGRESRVLTARGLSRAQDTALAAVESSVMLVAGTVAGVAGAVVVIGLTWGRAGVAALIGSWPFLVVVVIVLGATLVVAQLRAARAASRADSVAGRIARAASPGVALLLLLVGAVLVWQAGRLAPGAHDAWSTAVTMLAPTVGIACVAIIAVILLTPASALLARASARRTGVAPVYPARQVARRLSSFSVAVALVTIAVAGAVVAGAYDATWSTASTDSRRMLAGAPLRAAVEPATPGDLVAAAGAAGVDSAAPALTAAVVAGGIGGELIALPPASMPGVLFDVPGAPEATDLAAAVETPRLAVELPAEASGVRFEARIVTPEPAAAAAMEVRFWLDDAAGAPTVLPLAVSVDTADGALRLSAAADLPAGAAPWRIVAVEVSQGRGWPGVEIVLTGMQVLAVAGGETTPLVTPVANERLHPGAGGGAAVRSALVWAAGGESPPRVPAVLTAAFAAPLGLAVGDDVDLRFDGEGRTVAVTVAAIAAALPGTGAGAGALVSLDAVVDSSASTDATGSAVATPPFADEVWAAGDETAATAMGEALGVPVSTADSASSSVAGEVVTLWNAAAVGGALLAGVALIALLAALTAQRAGEVLVLRALGIGPTAQARMRGVEAVLVVALATVLGVAGGILLAALLVPHLAERAIPDAQLAPSLAFAAWPLAVTVVVIAVALGLAVLATSLAVRRQGASTRIEEAAP